MDFNNDLLCNSDKPAANEDVEFNAKMKREIDSVDDFEHLSDDNSKEKTEQLLIYNSELSNTSDDLQNAIDKRVETLEGAVNEVVDQTPNIPQNTSRFQGKDNMDSYIFEQGDSFPTAKDAEEKLDKYLKEMHKESPQYQDFISDDSDVFSSSALRKTTNDFVENEKGWNDSVHFESGDKLIEDDKQEAAETFGSVENLIDDFRDVKEEFDPHFSKQEDVPVVAPISSLVMHQPEKGEKETIKREENEEKIETKSKAEKDVTVQEFAKKDKKDAIEAEVFFCKMGLDTWFNPEKLNPKVEGLIYWRDPKKSGPVFGGVLVILLALTYFSLISVVAYLSLLGLTGTISFRIYKNVVQAVQKTGNGHPFKEFLEFDLTLPPEKVKELSEVGVAHVNAGLAELRRLFLVEDLIDSIKFGVFMWTLTYLGAWFNGMTLVILAWVALFTLPKVYETNKTQIDANLEIVKAKLADLTAKVKAAVPIGKKEEKKEQ